MPGPWLTVIDSLVGKITGSVSKSLLVAGLLPAATGVLGWKWYSRGWTGLEESVGGLAQEGAPPLGPLLMLAAGWLTLGLLLFALRSLVLRFFEDLPLGLLAPLRRHLLSRKHLERWRANRERERLELQYTALQWYMRDFASPRYKPWWMDDPDLNDAIRKSWGGRMVVQDLRRLSRDAPIRPTEAQVDTLSRGLLSLYAAGLSGFQDPLYVAEIDKWRALIGEPGAKDVLTAITEEVFRQWRIALARFESFPKGSWLQPTALGNQLAALDEYAEKRYGIDTGTLWSRLWGVVPEEQRQEVHQSRLGVETMLNLVVVFAGLAVAALTQEVIEGERLLGSSNAALDVAGLLFVSAPALLAFLSYKAAIFATRNLKEKMISLVDLHRLRWVRELGFSPLNVQEELELLSELRGFLTQGIPRKPAREFAGAEKRAPSSPASSPPVTVILQKAGTLPVPATPSALNGG